MKQICQQYHFLPLNLLCDSKGKSYLQEDVWGEPGLWWWQEIKWQSDQWQQGWGTIMVYLLQGGWVSVRQDLQFLNQ